MLKKIGIVLLVLVGLFILLVVFAPDADTPGDTGSQDGATASFSDDATGIEFSYPSEWEQATDADDYVAVLLIPYTPGANLFRPNVRLYTQTATDSAQSLEAYNEASKAQLVGDGTSGVSVVLNEETEFAGMPAYRLVTQQTDEASGIVFRSLAVYTIANGQEYLFTYSAPDELYDMHVADIEVVLQSMSI